MFQGLKLHRPRPQERAWTQSSFRSWPGRTPGRTPGQDLRAGPQVSQPWHSPPGTPLPAPHTTSPSCSRETQIPGEVQVGPTGLSPPLPTPAPSGLAAAMSVEDLSAPALACRLQRRGHAGPVFSELSPLPWPPSCPFQLGHQKFTQEVTAQAHLSLSEAAGVGGCGQPVAAARQPVRRASCRGGGGRQTL